MPFVIQSNLYLNRIYETADVFGGFFASDPVNYDNYANLYRPRLTTVIRDNRISPEGSGPVFGENRNLLPPWK